MAHNRGTLVQVPIRFRAYSYPRDWEIIREDECAVFESSALPFVDLKSTKLGDGWELIRQFLKLPIKDEQAILNFLLAHGSFGSPITERKEPGDSMVLPLIGRLNKPVERRKLVSERIPKQAFASLQEHLRRMLLTGDPTPAKPWKSTNSYSIRFIQTPRLGSEAEISVIGVFPTMLATVQFKLAQGAKFKECARKDCRLPFEVTSRHKRRFCTQYCAHFTSLRKRRKLQRTIKPENLQKKGR